MPTQVTDHVYDITCREGPEGDRYRVYLFTDGTPTLFDTGFADTVDTVRAAIDEIGVEPKRLVVTHSDGDHVGGYSSLVDTYDLETWVPTRTDDELTPEPTHRYQGGDTIGRFTAVHVPGHAPDNHALVDEEAGIAVLGDAVSGADQRGLPSGQFHLPPAVYSQSLNQAEESLERLLSYEFDVGLVFHGSSVIENASDKLDRYVNFPGK
ncbi:MBL fold metallo-hydrolase [Haloplanus pelagicus]|uniref:MBL fold metallo-hydrolase n=1 Tax=Haloplanus pelagicus TaxID=2949995 RepID=UPI00203F7C10|nr:MBL fold metallo-hydrolase [Haloplanus sp. HW8-1]